MLPYFSCCCSVGNLIENARQFTYAIEEAKNNNNFEYIFALKDFYENIGSKKTEQEYLNHQFEKEAQINSEYMTKLRDDYNGRKETYNDNGRNSSLHEPSNGVQLQNERQDLGLSEGRDVARGSSSESFSSHQKVARGIQETTSSSAIQSAKSIDDLTNVELQTIDDVSATLDKTIELDPEISGFTWKAIAKDAEKQAEVLEQAEACGLYNDLQAALTLNDVLVLVLTRH